MNSTMPWHNRGGISGDNDYNSGIFAFARQDAAPNPQRSHRTILLGY
ncbi:hypothetical protein FWG76_00155 [Candidatus Saccharibacteria bacterium]|nr:hypothetical protein [Candidatus Saccharibacteria bacterium]